MPSSEFVPNDAPSHHKRVFSVAESVGNISVSRSKNTPANMGNIYFNTSTHQHQEEIKDSSRTQKASHYL